jgi:2-phosphosulfolactate phosphatase
LKVNIFQGKDTPSIKAEVNIVIDVIRAFTFAHEAFLNGVKKIILVGEVETARKIKEKNSDYLLAGEVGGYPIEGFDLSNSPVSIAKHNLKNKTLIQRTTNGVQAALNCMDSKYTLVTGFTCAYNTVKFIQKISKNNSLKNINLVASHPTSDDDYACAEYIKSLIIENNSIKSKEVVERIKKSEVAQKFFDPSNKAFQEEDIHFCTQEIKSNFAILAQNNNQNPYLIKADL